MSSVLNGRELTRTFASLWLFFNLSFSLADDTFEIQLPKHRLQADELGVVVNDRDPLSLRIGKYYIQARGIPEDNLLHVSFQPGKKTYPLTNSLKSERVWWIRRQQISKPMP
ncbi:MAG: hypothetical protein ABW158_08540 [Candidatus Thiodiazotropha sp. 6PDIVS]